MWPWEQGGWINTQRERRPGSDAEREKTWGKEGVVMLLRSGTKERDRERKNIERQDNRITNRPTCLSGPRYL